MESNITINVVEPGSSTPVVPDTGLFTSGIGGPEATVLGIAAVVTVLAVIIAILYYRSKKQGKFISLKHKKATTVGLASLAIVVSLGTLAGLLRLGASAAEAEEVAEVTNGELTIELGDTPVLAYVPATVTVTEDMPAGYTLKAYSENPTLSAEGTDKTISMVTIPEDGLENAGTLTTALTDNTWGLSTEEPESQTQDIYFSLPATADEAVTIAEVEDTAAEGSDTVTVYYGVYITPGLPYGTYTGASIDYIVEANAVATVTFDGNNNFYFDGDTTKTTNVVSYISGVQSSQVYYSHTPNVNDAGVQDGLYPLDSNETFTYEFEGVDMAYVDIVKTANDDDCGPDQNDFLSIWAGYHPNFTAKDNWTSGEDVAGSGGKIVFDNGGKYDGVGVNIDSNYVTIAYTTSPNRQSDCTQTGYGYYAKITGYNPNLVVSGAYEKPQTDGAYRFLGWNTDKTATAPTYTSEEDIARVLDLSSGDPVTLYAIYEPAFTISYNGNGADTTTNMSNVEQYTTNLESTAQQVDLLASNFTKAGYGFAGWSTDANAWDDLTDDDTTNDPTIYGPNQTITVNPTTSTKLALYAVWVPAEQNNGNPVYLQDWQGCNSLTKTTYDTQTGTLTVGKNTITALTDQRDDSVYTVARLADGNCWMVENLKLDNEATIATTNTNNPLVVDNNVAIKNNDGSTSNHLSPTSSNWSNSWSSEEEQIACYNQSYLNTNNTARTAASPAFSQDFTSNAHSNFYVNIASYGNYYNWYSATAGNGTYSKSSGTTEGDICPKGWRIPDGSSQATTGGGSFYNLNLQMGGDTSSTGSNNWRSFPNNFVYSGDWGGSSADYRGSSGGYWSSTAVSTGSAYRLYFGSGIVGPGTNSSGKLGGNSVRCVAPVQ